MKNKYPEHIMRTLRIQGDLEPIDTSLDEELYNQYSSNEAFRAVLNWEGIVNYDTKIKNWIKDIYGVDLDSISK